jgi:hypothetical protein
MKITDRNVEEYIASLDDSVRSDIEKLYGQISDHMPGIEPKLWEGKFWGGTQQSIIGFGDLTYTRSDKKTVEWFMVGLTAQKNYISIYINATEDSQHVVKKYGHLLGKVKLGSASISFKKLSDVNVDELLKLVDKAYAQLSN